jgi:hypothetical protein
VPISTFGKQKTGLFEKQKQTSPTARACGTHEWNFDAWQGVMPEQFTKDIKTAILVSSILEDKYVFPSHACKRVMQHFYLL